MPSAISAKGIEEVAGLLEGFLTVNISGWICEMFGDFKVQGSRITDFTKCGSNAFPSNNTHRGDQMVIPHAQIILKVKDFGAMSQHF